MLDKIKDLIKEQAQEHFVNKTDVPNENAKEAAEAAGESIYETIKDKVLAGDFDGVKETLSGKDRESLKNDPIAQKTQETMSKKIQGKIAGIPKETADKAAESATPELIEKVSEKFGSEADEDADFDVRDLIKLVLTEEGREELLDKARNFLEDIAETIESTIESFFGDMFNLDGDDKKTKK